VSDAIADWRAARTASSRFKVEESVISMPVPSVSKRPKRSVAWKYFVQMTAEEPWNYGDINHKPKAISGKKKRHT
jgi:hypothetical protein